MKRMMEETKGLGQREIKGATKDFFIFESWVSSKMFTKASMDFVADIISMVKTDKEDYLRIPLGLFQPKTSTFSTSTLI